MDIRLATEALSRLNLAVPVKARAASRAACQCRQLHLPSTPYRQRTTNSRWAQRRGLTATSFRHAPLGGSAEGTEASKQQASDPFRASQRQSASQQPTQRSKQMPSDDEIASIVERSFQPGQQSTLRPLRFNQSRLSQQSDREPTRSQRPRQAQNNAQGSNSSRSPTGPTSYRSLNHPLGQNTSDNTYVGRRAPGTSRPSAVDMFESAMQRDPLGRRVSPDSSAGFLDGFTTNNGSASASGEGSRAMSDISDLLDMATGSRSGLTTGSTRPLPQSSLRLGSSVGRSIEIDPTRGVDLSKGIARLDMRLSSNRVRQDHRRNKFHERPGLKRKRLKSERWRKKFKLGFQTLVGRVKYLTNMGW